MTTALQAGRELDALVAKKVMGEDVGPDGLVPYQGRRVYPREYSESIASAWLVAGKMVEDGYRVRVEARRSGSYCDITAPDSGVNSVRENSIPLAICLAALAAVDVQGAE